MSKEIIIIKDVTTIKIFFLTLVILLILPGYAPARDLNASLGFLPNILESPEKGVFVDIVRAIDEVYKEGEIIINVYPFARSVCNVVNEKEVDWRGLDVLGRLSGNRYCAVRSVIESETN